MTDYTEEHIEELENIISKPTLIQDLCCIINRERNKLKPEWIKPEWIKPERLTYYIDEDSDFNLTPEEEDDDHYRLRILKSLWECFGDGYEFIQGRDNHMPTYSHRDNKFTTGVLRELQDPCVFYYRSPVPEVLEELNKLKAEFGYDT